MTRMALSKDELIARIAEAFETYRRLPDLDRKYRVARMTMWPQFVRDAAESYGYSETAVRLSVASPAEIDRAEELLDWMAMFLKLHPIGAKLLWLSYGGGLKMPECQVCLRREGVRMSRRTAFRKRDAAFGALYDGVCKSVPNRAKKVA